MHTWLSRGILPLLLLVTVVAGASPASAATGCAAADGPTAQASAAALAGSTLCLVNQERTSRGLKPLKSNRRLANAARNHSEDMVARGYFAHDTQGGGTFADRIRESGYVAARACPSLGEDLAWGSGTLATPRAIVAGWMASPGHRANILKRGFREAGMGVALGEPGAGADGVAYKLDFGSGGRK